MKGWVMDGIAKEAPHSLKLQNRTFYLPTRLSHKFMFNPYLLKFLLKKKTKVLFLHHRALLKYFDYINPENTRVFITHIDENDSLGTKELAKMAKINRMIFQNLNLMEWAIGQGIPKARCLVAHGAVSKDLFFPSSKLFSPKFVLISGELKSRKNPQMIRQLVLFRKDINFVIHGNGWGKLFDSELPTNLRISDFHKELQPRLAREASALLSISHNEGGPFPVIEALASGTPVLATNTGFCKELINKENGLVVDVPSDLLTIARSLDKVIGLKPKVFRSDLLPDGHSWQEFAKKLYIQ